MTAASKLLGEWRRQMDDLGWVADGLRGDEYDEMANICERARSEMYALLTALEKVLELCDECERPRHTQAPLVPRIRTALNEALETNE